MSRDHLRICVHCRAESEGLARRKYEVGPSKDGHCALCGSLYCQKCLRPLLPDGRLSIEVGLKIVGDSIHCAFADCGTGHSFMIDGAGRVVLSGASGTK
jgi:hypothetical protein